MKFSFTPDGTRLLCTYEDLATALATFDISENGHLIATYKYDPTPMTLSISDDGHVLATSVSPYSVNNENTNKEQESQEGTQNE